MWLSPKEQSLNSLEPGHHAAPPIEKSLQLIEQRLASVLILLLGDIALGSQIIEDIKFVLDGCSAWGSRRGRRGWHDRRDVGCGRRRDIGLLLRRLALPTRVGGEVGQTGAAYQTTD